MAPGEYSHRSGTKDLASGKVSSSRFKNGVVMDMGVRAGMTQLLNSMSFGRRRTLRDVVEYESRTASLITAVR